MNEVCLLEPELSYSPAVGGQDRVIPVKKVKLETHLTLSLLAPVAADAKICQCARWASRTGADNIPPSGGPESSGALYGVMVWVLMVWCPKRKKN